MAQRPAFKVEGLGCQAGLRQKAQYYSIASVQLGVKEVAYRFTLYTSHYILYTI